MTAVIAGVVTVANLQGAQADDRRLTGDSTDRLNTVADEQGGAAALKETDNDIVASVNQSPSIGGTVDNTVKSGRKKDFGVGGGPIPGIVGLDMTPVKEFIRNNRFLNGKTFPTLDNSRFHVFFTMGGMGYLCVGSGVRLGLAGLSGEHNFMSDRCTSDSSVLLSVKAEYGGLIIEKAFHREYYNFYTGMQIGGGSLRVKYRADDESVFDVSSPKYEEDAGRESTVHFNMLEIHGGLSYTFAPFVHIGADISVPLFYSATGFNAYASGFTTVNPAVAVRLMLGNRG
jgi:hypothetical protein